MKTHLAILWHMHQPYYRNMRTGACSMPWTRIHGIHSYYDMVSTHMAHPAFRATINFVPCLIKQLHAYVHDGASDEFLDLTLKPAEKLTEAEREFLIRHFFAAPYQRMIAPHARYRMLFERRGAGSTQEDFTEAIRFYSPQDFRDIQVYYNLIWFGFTAKDELPLVRQMLESGGHFSEEDKKGVIDAQRTVLAKVLEGIAQLARSEHVEISTTPFYHPILPLLIDTSIAKRPRPKAKLPEEMRAPQFAAYQVQRALDYMEEATGARPRGMWPAEGSVCPEMIPIMAAAGVEWIATDEGILGNSKVDGKERSSFQPFGACADGASIPIVFRHRELSDKVGFVYSGMDARRAVEDFIATVKALGAHGPKDMPPLVTVILDGENPWEHYQHSGKEFLSELFTRLPHEDIETTTVSRFIAANPPKRRIEKLASGSWINADFSIWSGKPQKNEGWRYIKLTLDELGGAIAPRDDMSEKQRGALESFSAACGSDWFWWYDDDFESTFKSHFDKVFRGHLANAFTYLGRDVPLYLYEPIYHFEDTERAFIEPPSFIHPHINGLSDSYFEWSNAVQIDMHRFGGAMAQSGDDIKSVFFGYDREALYVRIDPQDRKKGLHLADGESLMVSVLGTEVDCRMQVAPGEDGLQLTSRAEGQPEEAGAKPEFAAGSILELKCPFACFPHKVGTELTLVVSLYSGDAERRRYAHIRFAVPDEHYEKRMWTV